MARPQVKNLMVKSSISAPQTGYPELEVNSVTQAEMQTKPCP